VLKLACVVQVVRPTGSHFIQVNQLSRLIVVSHKTRQESGKQKNAPSKCMDKHLFKLNNGQGNNNFMCVLLAWNLQYPFVRYRCTVEPSCFLAMQGNVLVTEAQYVSMLEQSYDFSFHICNTVPEKSNSVLPAVILVHRNFMAMVNIHKPAITSQGSNCHQKGWFGMK